MVIERSCIKGFDANRLERIDTMLEHYIADKRSAGMVALVSRQGEPVYCSVRGLADIARQTPMLRDTIFRIYSMTKPVTSVALMTLLEQGHCHLDDAAYRWIPALRDLTVYIDQDRRDPIASDITIRQLLTHTAGFSYGFEPDINPVDAMYQGAMNENRRQHNLADWLADLFELPLIAQPGERWHYSIATDICGYLVELMSDMPFGDYLQKKIFDPLAMIDTGFLVPVSEAERFAALYSRTKDESLVELESASNSPFLAQSPAGSAVLQSGGGGLVSTIDDYWRFAQMMLNGGELDGVRVLGRKTVEWMIQNHLPSDLLPISFNGVVPQLLAAYGFGLGYAINIDPSRAGTLGSAGDFGWGGVADTYCWVDPKEQLIGILMQQFTPSLTHPGRRDFRNAVYQALID